MATPSLPRYPASYDAYHRLSYREKGQSGSAATGTVAAALAAASTLWTLRYPELTPANPAGGPASLSQRRLHVFRISVVASVLVNFTTTNLAGRGLILVRGAPTTANTASNPSGGAAYTMVRHRSDMTAGEEVLGVGRIATTAGLTTTGFTFETNAIRRLPMVVAGSAGTAYTATWDLDDAMFLLPGELLAIQAAANFDAAGTFEVDVDVDACEVP